MTKPSAPSCGKTRPRDNIPKEILKMFAGAKNEQFSKGLFISFHDWHENRDLSKG
jgi:hypothetical protein